MLYKFKPLLTFTNMSSGQARLAGLINYIHETWDKDRPARISTLAHEATSSRQVEDPKIFEYAKSKGVKLLPFNYHPFTATDFSTELKRIYNKEKADYLWLRTASTASIMKDAARMGLKDKMTYVVASIVVMPNVAELAGAETMEGVMGISSGACLAVDDVPAVHLARKIQNKYRKRIPLSNGSLGGTLLAMIGHEAIKRSLTKVGLKKMGGSDISNAVWSLKNFDMKGLSPNITMEKGNISLVPYIRFVTWKNGEIIPFGDGKWRKIPWVEGNNDFQAAD